MSLKVTKVVLNRSGVRTDLLQSQATADFCEKVASNIVAGLPDGYAVEKVYTGRNRINVGIKAETYDAYRDNLENNTLLKAVKV